MRQGGSPKILPGSDKTYEDARDAAFATYNSTLEAAERTKIR